MSFSDTIVAPATPPGRGSVAMVRVSGPLVKKIAEALLKKIPDARYATHTLFFDENSQPIDQGIVLFFPAPHSFTGEDVLELQSHGSPIIVDCLIKRMVALGARMAKPGEFSERAFLNNKMDLAQAEAIADLINASSEQAMRASLRSLQGDFSKKIHSLVESVIHLRMYVEAAIDFVEEEIDFLADQQIINDLVHIIHRLEDIQKNALQGSLLRDGITVVIAGKPNVGKSSLLNQLSGKDIAIVTDIAGTTRDVLREEIILDGMPIHFIDTAGLRESEDPVEQEGIRRARDEISRADLILSVTDEKQIEDKNSSLQIPTVFIRNKIDLTQEVPTISQEKNKTVISLSAKTGEGIPLLKSYIKSQVGFTATTEGTFSARRRHLDALSRAKEFLSKGKDQKAIDLLAENLRLTQLALNEITGEFTSDDLLGRIFGDFCIGK